MSTKNKVVAYLAKLIKSDAKFDAFAEIIDLPAKAVASIKSTHDKPADRITEAMTTKSLIGDGCGLSVHQVVKIAKLTETDPHLLMNTQQQQHTADLESIAGAKPPPVVAATKTYTSPHTHGSAVRTPRKSGSSIG